MGIWDYISSTTDSIKQNAPDPAPVKGLYWSSYDSIKRCVPDLTTVKGFYLSSYGYSRAAVTRIHDAVDKLDPHLPDVETRSKIATNLAKQTANVAVREGAKCVPGGSTVYEIVLRSIPGEKKSKEYKEDMQAFKDTVGRTESKQEIMKQELNDCRRLLEQHEMHKLIMELKTQKALDLNKKPEDIIGIFKTTESTVAPTLCSVLVAVPTKSVTGPADFSSNMQGMHGSVDDLGGRLSQ